MIGLSTSDHAVPSVPSSPSAINESKNVDRTRITGVPSKTDSVIRVEFSKINRQDEVASNSKTFSLDCLFAPSRQISVISPENHRGRMGLPTNPRYLPAYKRIRSVLSKPDEYFLAL